MVTHHGRRCSAERPISAAPVSALSAMGSASVPKAVTSPRERASSPSKRSVIGGDHEHGGGGVAPADALARVGEQGPQEHRDEQQPHPGEHVGHVQQGRRARRHATHPALTATPPADPTSPLRGMVSPGRDLQVRALGADDDSAHQIADGQSGPPLDHALAIDLGRLVGRAPRALEVLVLRGLDQHGDLGADAVFCALGHQLLGEGGDPLDPRGDLLLRDLAVVARGLGAVLVGVAEDPHRVEPGAFQEGLQLGDVVFGLAREPDDHVAADPRLGRQRPDAGAEVEEVLSRTEAPHPPQEGGAGVLEREVEVGRDARRGRDDLDQVGPHLGGLQVGDADAVDARHVGEPGQQPHQRAGATGQVLAVGRGVLTDQHELAHTLVAEPGRLGHDVVRRARQRTSRGRTGSRRTCSAGRTPTRA